MFLNLESVAIFRITGAGASSSGSTLAAHQGSESGRATLDDATRITLEAAGGWNMPPACPPARERLRSISVRSAEIPSH